MFKKPINSHRATYDSEVQEPESSSCCVPPSEKKSPILRVENLSVRIRHASILDNISLEVASHSVFGLIGPSGAGKSTLLRCMNRMIEMTPGAEVTGRVRFHGENIYAHDVDADALRARIGMIFQQPVVFPASIERNVLFGIRPLRHLPKPVAIELVERSLREASLWEEVKDRLHTAGQTLSIGQQQRLCLARTLATNPEVILMDEPTSALDARSSEAIESLILQLKSDRTIILVTHNLEQARRVTDWVGCLCPAGSTGAGELSQFTSRDVFFESKIITI